MRRFPRSGHRVSLHGGHAPSGGGGGVLHRTSRAMDGAWRAPRDGSSESGVTHRHRRRGSSTASTSVRLPLNSVARSIARATTHLVDTGHENTPGEDAPPTSELSPRPGRSKHHVVGRVLQVDVTLISMMQRFGNAAGEMRIGKGEHQGVGCLFAVDDPF